MPRDIDSTTLAALGEDNILCGFFAQLTFKSKTEYVWTGVGPYQWNGQTWTGLGSVVSIGTFAESTELAASGLVVTMSGIDNDILGECLADIQLGAPANVWWALFNEDMSISGTPIPYFGGIVDKPTVDIDSSTSSISLNLETNMIRMQQGQKLRYTSSDQRRLYPGDSAFDRVERLNDEAIVWVPS